MKQSKIIIGLFLLVVSIISCNDDDNIVEPKGDYENGILIASEGPFLNGTGTVTFLSNDYLITEANIYNNVNNEDIGSILQSIGFYNNNAYLVANNSHSIAVVNRYTFAKTAKIESGLNNPRYFVEVDGKGYVTNWGNPSDNTDDFIAVINLDSNTIETTISVVEGPENIVAVGNTVYVAHQGGYSQNNKISVINANSNTVTKTIEVGDVPVSITVDASDNIWVLASGKASWTGSESKGVLSKISSSTNEVIINYNFITTEHPKSLSIDGGNLYYNLNGNVFKMEVAATVLPTTEEISALFCYNMVANNGKLYATDALDYNSNGKLYIYDLSTKALLKTIETGIIPGGIYFN